MLKNKIFLVTTFTVLFLCVRLPQLKTDAINPDGYNWHYRSEQFINGLKYLQIEKTYQHYHPGVTLMWLTGVPIEVYKQITGDTVYNHENFLQFHLVAKLSLVFVQLGLSLWIFWLLVEYFGGTKAFFITTLFSLEPFFVGNSRLYHMDTLLSLLLFLGLVLTFKNLKTPNKKTGITAGLILALAFLTKSIAIGAVLYALFSVLFLLRTKKSRKKILMYFFSFLISFVAFTILLFPALWVKPAFYLNEVFSEAERVGIRKGHEQIIMGEYTTEAGVGFYPLVLLIKVSPLTWLGVTIYLIFMIKIFFFGRGFEFVFSNLSDVPGHAKKQRLDRLKAVLRKYSSKNKNFGLVLFLTVFYLGYFVAMTYPTKKIDRYMLPLYPWMAIISVLGFSYAFKYFKAEETLANKETFIGVTSFLALLFLGAPLVEKSPYYFTYTSPVFINAEYANRIIAQKPFGIGIPALKDHILEKYGDYPTLGFYDTKPMRAIYPNSKVFDVRVNGPSDYDIYILGPNETTPEEVIETGMVYEKSSSLYINGLEYWRVYVKKEPR